MTIILFNLNIIFGMFIYAVGTGVVRKLGVCLNHSNNHHHNHQDLFEGVCVCARKGRGGVGV